MTKIQSNTTNKSQEVSNFPVGDHKAAMKRRISMKNTRHKPEFEPQWAKTKTAIICHISKELPSFTSIQCRYFFHIHILVTNRSRLSHNLALEVVLFSIYVGPLVQLDNHSITMLHHPNQCRHCTLRDISC